MLTFTGSTVLRNRRGEKFGHVGLPQEKFSRSHLLDLRRDPFRNIGEKLVSSLVFVFCYGINVYWDIAELICIIAALQSGCNCPANCSF